MGVITRGEIYELKGKKGGQGCLKCFRMLIYRSMVKTPLKYMGVVLLHTLSTVIKGVMVDFFF